MGYLGVLAVLQFFGISRSESPELLLLLGGFGGTFLAAILFFFEPLEYLTKHIVTWRLTRLKKQYPRADKKHLDSLLLARDMNRFVIAFYLLVVYILGVLIVTGNSSAIQWLGISGVLIVSILPLFVCVSVWLRVLRKDLLPLAAHLSLISEFSAVLPLCTLEHHQSMANSVVSLGLGGQWDEAKNWMIHLKSRIMEAYLRIDLATIKSNSAVLLKNFEDGNTPVVVSNLQAILQAVQRILLGGEQVLSLVGYFNPRLLDNLRTIGKIRESLSKQLNLSEREFTQAFLNDIAKHFKPSLPDFFNEFIAEVDRVISEVS